MSSLRRVLVTGGAGFIGSHACEALVAAGHAVRVLDDFSRGSRANLAAIAGRIEIHEGSIESPDAVARAASGCDAVVHLAALTSVDESLAEPERYLRVNAGGTAIVARAAESLGCARFVFASSSSIYGDHAAPQDEALPPRPLSPYATSKVEGERLVRALGGGCDGVSLRFFNVYGPRQDPKSAYAGVIARFLDRMRAGERVVVFGDGLQTRDFVAVGDVARAIALAVAAPGPLRGAAVNIGTGRGTNVVDLACAVAAACGVPPRIDHAPARAGEVRDSSAVVERAAALIGFRATTALADGLRAMP